MRTTLAIDDDILAAARELAATEGTTMGAVISSLARNALRPDATRQRTRNGVPLLPVCPDAVAVTGELIRQLDEELL